MAILRVVRVVGVVMTTGRSGGAIHRSGGGCFGRFGSGGSGVGSGGGEVLVVIVFIVIVVVMVVGDD